MMDDFLEQDVPAEQSQVSTELMDQIMDELSIETVTNAPMVPMQHGGTVHGHYKDAH